MEKKNNEKIQILDKTLQKGFTPLPRIILRNPQISRNCKCTYALLLDYAWQKGSCFPGQERLAQDLGVSVRTIQRDLEDLRTLKLIDWDQRGRNKTNIYYILPISNNTEDIANERDTTELSCPDTSNLSDPDTTKMSYIIEEDNYKKKEYKKPLTLSNDNGEINLNSFDSEAVEIAKQLNDIESIKFYQKLIKQRNRGEISNEDIQSALDDTRRMIRTDQVDGTNFLRNPAAWFVSVLKKLSSKKSEKEKQEKVKSMLEDFKKSFISKSIVSIIILFLSCMFFISPVKAENPEITIESVYGIHNEVRTENGLSEFVLSEELTKSAYLKAVTMLLNNCWSHYCPDSPWKDIDFMQYEYYFAGENLAYGFESTNSMIKAWLDSPDHRKNILNPNYQEIGIAVIKGDFNNSEDETIVVVHFAKPKVKEESDFLSLKKQAYLITNTS